jgi:hypothetical protein
MAIYKAGNKIFGNISVQSANVISPIIGYGRLDDIISMNSYYAYVLPFWTNVAKTIATVTYEVTTAATQTNTPTLELAAYQSHSDYVQPTKQIANSYVSGISTASTGVKSASFSASWILPVGLTLLVVKTFTANYNGNFDFGIRSFNQNAQALLGQFIGFATPISQYSSAPYVQLYPGNGVHLASDLTSSPEARYGNNQSALGFFLGQ